MTVKSIPTGPFFMGAVHYLDAGWRPLPLPANRKSSPPEGWTGGSKPHSGETPDRAQIARWAMEYPQGNLCVSPPKNVIGIDVDVYGEKAGAATFLNAQEAWGELPDTWISTSRPKAPKEAKHKGVISGIRWYRIQEGLAWPGQLPQGGGVELIRWDHRYGIVAPSTNPHADDAEYLWIRPDGSVVTDEFPAPEDLPDLPDRWLDGLTSGRKPWVAREEVELDPAEITQWIEDRGDHEQCGAMDRTARKHLQELRKAGPDGGAHDQMRDAVWALIGDAAAGHKGVRKALDRLKLAFWESVKGRRSKAEASSEWSRALAGGVQKVVAEGEPEDDDLCELDEVSRAPKERKRIGATDSYPRNDTGNARRFATRYRNSVRWVAAYDSWFIWSDRLNVWVMDRDGEAMRMAQETAGTIAQEAEFEEDPKTKSAIRKFATASANEGKLKAMLGVARTLKGMSIDGNDLNARRDLLVCPNGTLELEDSSRQVRLRPSRLEDFNTISTGTNYRANATLPEWEKFLERFLPDLEIRDWLQTIAGYSLLGKNPKRVMAVAFGDTSTGKTTFANAVAFALGPYAASTTMTVFRDNQDEKPRPDLVRVLDKRLAYAEEASSSWRLHPDQIKRVTGGAPITARVPFAKEYLEVQPAFTPWLLTNHAPTIEGADAALRRRVSVIPFDVQIPKNEEDPAFEDLLKSERGREAVLAWLVEGYQRYLNNPDAIGETPAAAIEPTMRFWSEVSDFAAAMQDLCEYGEPDEYRAIPSQLYQAYLAWCTEHGVKESDRLSGTKFGRELTGMQIHKRNVRIEGKVTTMRIGIRLKAGWIKALNGA